MQFAYVYSYFCYYWQWTATIGVSMFISQEILQQWCNKCCTVYLGRDHSKFIVMLSVVGE